MKPLFVAKIMPSQHYMLKTAVESFVSQAQETFAREREELGNGYGSLFCQGLALAYRWELLGKVGIISADSLCGRIRKQRLYGLIDSEILVGEYREALFLFLDDEHFLQSVSNSYASLKALGKLPYLSMRLN